MLSARLVGRNLGMTRVFTETGESIPVTVIESLDNHITAVREKRKDGYNAIQVTTGSCKKSRMNKPTAGNYKKAGLESGRGLWEFRLLDSDVIELKVGDVLTQDQFTVGQKVDVIGTSKGKGFAGTVKRHNFRTQDATHGNSRSHRVPGSIGQNQTPGRVFKGKKMAGRLGGERVTVQNLEIVRVDSNRNVLLIKGAIPGCAGGSVIIRAAIKQKLKKETA